TAAILFALLTALNVPMGLRIVIVGSWYLFGIGAAYAVYQYHHPELQLGELLAPFTKGGAVPAGFNAVTFVNQGRTVFVPDGGNLREFAKTQGVEVYYDVAKQANCFGLGFCGTCRFTPDQKNLSSLSEPTWQERFTLGADVGKVRLACQTTVLASTTVDNRVAEEFGEVHHFTVINGAIATAFSLVVLGVILWIGGDMIGLF
ncbi:MAG: 2Fe-2S iron-sulfur cluster binding domain-containing protein, partial [bacterium]|nr:2Fe-2S iron-sulfur cluster binding domain-containing protein [Candidatus Kapabacteria bacterium]